MRNLVGKTQAWYTILHCTSEFICFSDPMFTDSTYLSAYFLLIFHHFLHKMAPHPYSPPPISVALVRQEKIKHDTTSSIIQAHSSVFPTTCLRIPPIFRSFSTYFPFIFRLFCAGPVLQGIRFSNLRRAFHTSPFQFTLKNTLNEISKF